MISAVRLLGGHAVEGREEAQLFADLHLRVETALLGQVSPRVARQRDVLGPHPRDAAGIGAEDVEDDPHCCRLARPVGAEQPENPARLDAEAGAIERDDVTEALRQSIENEAHTWSPSNVPIHWRASAATLTVADRLPARGLCYTRDSEPPRALDGGAAAVRGMHALSEESFLHEDRCSTRDGGGGDARRAHAPDRRPAGRRRPRGARPGRGRRGVLQPRRGVPRGRGNDRPGRGAALQPGRHGAPRRAALGRGGRDAALGIGPHRHPGHARQAGAGAEAGGARRDRHQHGRHPADHPRPVDGHALQPGDRRAATRRSSSRPSGCRSSSRC